MYDDRNFNRKSYFQNSTSFVLVNEKGIIDVIPPINKLKKYSSIHSTKMDDILNSYEIYMIIYKNI